MTSGTVIVKKIFTKKIVYFTDHTEEILLVSCSDFLESKTQVSDNGPRQLMVQSATGELTLKQISKGKLFNYLPI